MAMNTNTVHDGISPSNEQSIFAMLEKVMLQVGYQYFADVHFKRIDPLYKELCLIIAETMFANRDSVIKVNGEYIRAWLVHDVFSQIRNRHIQLVFDNFQNVTIRVANKKAYLRTALYNSVFEFQAHFVNDMVQG